MFQPSVNLLESKKLPRQDFKTHGHYDEVKSRSHDIAHLQPLTNVPTKYQLPTSYSCRDIARTRFFIGQGQIKVTP